MRLTAHTETRYVVPPGSRALTWPLPDDERTSQEKATTLRSETEPPDTAEQ
ncbi:hypothetical protein PV334_33855 [Streptomyces sp. ME02-7008A-1]|uniref:hypothetical protein n=1 Tax=unclassified Streptomyces TaxID=2593676 RepID=UPI0029BEEB66|nr:MULTISPECIES: hypothetical protein [unclassified Streptomyces]MDX3186223.1 hypothetical protein [Streptomyces sp. ME02-7008A-1]MDX3307328.1 hypothetical protein [Streptomyces sp. ME02-7008A]